MSYTYGWIILSGVMALVVTLAWLVLKGNLRIRHQPRVRTPEQLKKLVSAALHQLNCRCEWKKDQETLYGRYDYQSGHFRIRIEKDTPYVQLSYLFFFSTGAGNLGIVRDVCNQCNLNASLIRVVYTTNEKEYKVDVHILAGLFLTEGNAKGMLTDVMTDVFSWQNMFSKRFDELLNRHAGEQMPDSEARSMVWKREYYLLREQEMLHQQAGSDWREDDYSRRITVGQLLGRALGVADFRPVELRMAEDDGFSLQQSEAEIRRYPVSEAILGPQANHSDDAHCSFIRPEATLYLTYYDNAQPRRKRLLTIHLLSGEATEGALYYRITLSVVPQDASPATPVGSRNNRLHAVSFVAAYDLESTRRQQSKFLYLWKDALDKKQKGNDDELSEEQRLICNCVDEQLAQFIFQGHQLFLARRYYEALPSLVEACGIMQGQFGQMRQEMRAVFYEVCYFIGFCYGALHRYELAYYYLEITLPLHRINYTEEYINCLVNGGDHRAMDVIDALTQEMRKVISDEEEPLAANVAFLNFLKRRKAYVYIDRQNYDAAEAMLKRMLDDPANSDFAISELAYIRKLRELETDRK